MKITINNEEVLCNKDFTINEEMLNTSSVILNNVYPATWEQNKNYVSRFYYPKDYSKCKIFNEIEHPGEREDVEGTNFSISVDTTKQYQVQTLKGQTSQSGTPTPTNPQQINITTGEQDIWVAQNQLLPPNWEQGMISTSDGITISANAYWVYTPEFLDIHNLDNITVSFKETCRAIVFFYNQNKVKVAQSQGFTVDNVRTYQPSTNNYYYMKIGYNLNGTAEATNPTTIYNHEPMVNKGTTALPYEKGNTYPINLGKNLIYLSSNERTLNGLTGTINGNQISISGTNTKTDANWVLVSTNVSTSIFPDFKVGETYTLSVDKNVSNVYFQINYYKSGTTTQASLFSLNITSAKNTTFTVPSDFGSIAQIFVGILRTATTINETFNIQLEKGSVASSFSAYKTPIYLGEMRNTNNVVIAEDYIFRNTQENPLYDSNLEEGQWYIHKEIGRVVLNGSESGWGYDSNNSVFINNSSIFNGQYLVQNGASNYFKNVVNANITNNYYAGQNLQNGEFSFRVGTKDRLYLKNTSYTNVNDFKTWLQSHNVSVYYVLNTPTNTLIEDEELINQLNSIELLEGLNNVSITSPNLSFIMSLMYNYQEGYTEEDILFCGVVENTGNISLNPRYPHYCNLQVLDFKTFLSEGETLDFVIYNKTILEAINQVVGAISDYGFILGNVNINNQDDVIGAYSTKDKTAYDVFNYIADITQSRWTTRMIDENTVAIDFYDPSLMPQGTSIEYKKVWFTNHKIQDMSFSYSSRDYRNKQVMLSGEVYANVETTEIIVADGYQTQFNTTDKIGYVSSMLVNGSPVQVITKEEYELGYEGDFVYQPGSAYFESVDLVSTGAIITIVYYAVIEGREVLLNQEEISRVENMIDRKGVIARYENRNDATTTKELQAIGQSYLKYKGSPEVILKVESLENIWNIGERVQFSAPLEELTTEYMVKKKTINYITTQENVFYTFELSSSFNSETEINYFDNQRSKMMGNIGVGEVVSRNIDIENTANIIFYGLEINEVEVEGNSTLQSELQSVLGGDE